MGTYVRTQNIDHTVGERGSVSLSVHSADVSTRGIAGADAHVRATFEIEAGSDADADRIFDEIKLSVSLADGELTAQERDNPDPLGKLFTRFFGGGGYELSVDAEIPSNAQLRLTAVSSDMDVKGLRGEQRYRSVSGDLSLSDVGGSVRLDTVSGDSTIRAVEPLELQVQGVSGDVNVTAPLLRSLRASTVSGDVELEAEFDASGDFRVETVSGDLTVGLLGSGTFEIHGLSTDVHCELDHRLEGQVDRRRLIVGDGGPRLVFNSMSGDADVRRPRRIGASSRPARPAPEPSPAEKESQLEVLRALERGEIDVDEATRRLAGGA